MQRCMDRVGDEGTRCAEACACEDPESGKPPTAKCKKSCGGCKSDAASKLNLCKRIAEAPSVVARAPEPKSEGHASSRSRTKHAAPAAKMPHYDPPKLTPRQKRDDKKLQQMEL